MTCMWFMRTFLIANFYINRRHVKMIVARWSSQDKSPNLLYLSANLHVSEPLPAVDKLKTAICVRVCVYVHTDVHGCMCVYVCVHI